MSWLRLSLVEAETENPHILLVHIKHNFGLLDERLSNWSSEMDDIYEKLGWGPLRNT